MKCRDIKAIMGPYLYGDLSPEEMRAVRLHAQECDACRIDLRERGAVISAFDDSAQYPTEAERQMIFRRVNEATKNGSVAVRPLSFQFALVGASVLLTLGVGYLLGNVIARQKAGPSSIASISAPSRPDGYGVSSRKDQNSSKTGTIAQNDSAKPGELGHDGLEPSSPVDQGAIAEAVRRSAIIGTITTRGRIKDRSPRTIVLDEPLPVVDSPASQTDHEGSGNEPTKPSQPPSADVNMETVDPPR